MTRYDLSWKRLRPGMFFLLDSGDRPKMFRFRRDYRDGKAMTALIEVANIHYVDSKVATIYLKTHAIRNYNNPRWIAPTKDKIANSEVRDPEKFFSKTRIILLK